MLSNDVCLCQFLSTWHKVVSLRKCCDQITQCARFRGIFFINDWNERVNPTGSCPWAADAEIQQKSGWTSHGKPASKLHPSMPSTSGPASRSLPWLPLPGNNVGKKFFPMQVSFHYSIHHSNRNLWQCPQTKNKAKQKNQTTIKPTNKLYPKAELLCRPFKESRVKQFRGNGTDFQVQDVSH